MKKFSALIIIFSLMISTTIIKNTAKKVEDEIFSVKENIRILESEHKYIVLENSYLSSSEKLLKFQELYFEDTLDKISIDNLGIIKFSSNNIYTEKVKFK